MLKLFTGIFILFTIFAFSMCIDPYVPKLTEYESLLVVDGMITNAVQAYKIRLSRTFQDLNAEPANITDARVSITDDKGNEYHLTHSGNGIYQTDSTIFTGIAGRTYTLHVKTSEDEEFESEPCLMEPVPEIDSVYFEKGEQMINNNTESQEGLIIYVNSGESETNKYYRWTYDETWKFKVPNPKKYDYIKGPSGNEPFIPLVTDVKEYCWKNAPNNEILIRSMAEGQQGKIEKQPVSFIATETSDRLLIRYSILVSQYSISKDEYDFWNNLKQVNETGGDIFAKQPYSVVSNIHNKNNPVQRVLGFFQVSAMSQKRKYIDHAEISLMGLKFYSYPCSTVQYSPADFETKCACPPKTWDDVYWYLCIADTYTFIQPIYQGLGDSLLLKLEFTRPECADCELTGIHTKPGFWEDHIVRN